MIVKFMHPKCTFQDWGEIPSFLKDDDPRPAREQFNERYAHGGGWNPMKGHTMQEDILSYPGDPDLHPASEITFRDERVLLYPYEIVAIIQRDGTYEVARMN